jgi:hypothetical protein
VNASVRWANHFIEALECVRCRKKENLKLYDYYKKPVDPEILTVEQLQKLSTRMDVWCDSCTPKINQWVTGFSRVNRRAEAAIMASLRSAAETSATYDAYTLGSGKIITKRAVLEHYKNAPCAVCGQKFPGPVMDFHNVFTKKRANISRLMNARCTIHDVVEELEQCTILCANCHRLVLHNYIKQKFTPISVNMETI